MSIEKQALSSEMMKLINELAEYSNQKIKLETTKSMVLAMYKQEHLSKEEIIDAITEICQKQIVLDTEQFRMVLDEETIDEIALNLGAY